MHVELRAMAICAGCLLPHPKDESVRVKNRYYCKSCHRKKTKLRKGVRHG